MERLKTYGLASQPLSKNSLRAIAWKKDMNYLQHMDQSSFNGMVACD